MADELTIEYAKRLIQAMKEAGYRHIPVRVHPSEDNSSDSRKHWSCCNLIGYKGDKLQVRVMNGTREFYPSPSKTHLWPQKMNDDVKAICEKVKTLMDTEAGAGQAKKLLQRASLQVAVATADIPKFNGHDKKNGHGLEPANRVDSGLTHRLGQVIKDMGAFAPPELPEEMSLPQPPAPKPQQPKLPPAPVQTPEPPMPVAAPPAPAAPAPVAAPVAAPVVVAPPVQAPPPAPVQAPPVVATVPPVVQAPAPVAAPSGPVDFTAFASQFLAQQQAMANAGIEQARQVVAVIEQKAQELIEWVRQLDDIHDLLRKLNVPIPPDIESPLSERGRQKQSNAPAKAEALKSDVVAYFELNGNEWAKSGEIMQGILPGDDQTEAKSVLTPLYRAGTLERKGAGSGTVYRLNPALLGTKTA